MPSPALLREWLLASLSEPNTALLVLFLGSLAIYAELLLPGAVLPGCLGAIASLLSLFALTRHPLHPGWAAAIPVAIAMILAEARWPLHGLVAGAGIVLLVAALRFLLLPPPSIGWATALATGTIWGVTTCFLARIAWRAYANKQL